MLEMSGAMAEATGERQLLFVQARRGSPQNQTLNGRHCPLFLSSRVCRFELCFGDLLDEAWTKWSCRDHQKHTSKPVIKCKWRKGKRRGQPFTILLLIYLLFLVPLSRLKGAPPTHDSVQPLNKYNRDGRVNIFLQVSPSLLYLLRMG